MRKSLIVPAIAAAILAANLQAEETKFDPTRPIPMLGQTEFTLQWSTPAPCQTKIQLRKGGEPCNTWYPEGQEYKPWQNEFQTFETSETSTYHRITITGLQPATRYYYRLNNGDIEPTNQETRWGAEKSWSREYAVSTLAPDGYKTVIRVPVKVIIMPNVYSLYTAKNKDGEWAPLPPPMNEQDKAKLIREFELAKRFWFVNNGFRVWHDLQYFWDERPQYWGEMPDDAPEEYKKLVPCRNWPGNEFSGPGGGDFSISDTRDLTKINHSPIHDGYVGQIENDLLQRYDWNAKKWEWCISGGGTLGIDGWPEGIPSRSQFLGDDIAWLTTHEYHHEIESQTYLSGLDQENDRVVFDHFSNRFRYQKPDGSFDEFPWDCGGKFGEHWSGIAMTDRQLTDIQWLRYYFGETIMVPDQDEDDVPDGGDVPFTELKYGYDPETPETDGTLNDFQKIRQSIWSGGAMSPWYSRQPEYLAIPDPNTPDSDGDGIPDIEDPLPTIPYPPFIWAKTIELDANPEDWNTIPYIGKKTVEQTTFSYKQAHDDSFYYGLVEIEGPFWELNIMLDGEADGIYNGFEGFGRSKDLYEIHIDLDRNTQEPQVRYSSLGKGFESKAKKENNKVTVEFSIENRGDSTWFWQGAGREIGNAVTLRLPNKAQYTLGDGYQPTYCFMEPLQGTQTCPVTPNQNLTEQEADVSLDFSKNPDLTQYEFTTQDWDLTDGALILKQDLDPDASCYLLVPGFTGNGDFTVFMEFEATQDAVLGAFSKDTKHIDPGQDSIGFIGGYLNELSKIRLINMGEVTEERIGLTPGKHTMQFQRQGKYFFMLYDGKEIGWYRETTPRPAHRLGVVGIPGSNIKIYKFRVKGEK